MDVRTGAATGRGGNVDGRTGGCPPDGDVPGWAPVCVALGRGASGGTNGRGTLVDGAGRPTPNVCIEGSTSGTLPGPDGADVPGDAGVCETPSLAGRGGVTGAAAVLEAEGVALAGACVGAVTRGGGVSVRIGRTGVAPTDDANGVVLGGASNADGDGAFSCAGDTLDDPTGDTSGDATGDAIGDGSSLVRLPVGRGVASISSVITVCDSKNAAAPCGAASLSSPEPCAP